MIIAGFQGIEKTILGKKYSNVIDFDAMLYMYDLTENQKKMSYEEIKGIDKIRNKNYPENYIKEILKIQKEYDIVLISPHKKLLEELNRRKIEYTVAFPMKECLEEYIERYKRRGNPKIYLIKRKNSFLKQIEYLENSKCEQWRLKQGEYLEDILKKNKIKLIKKEKKENE